MKKFIFIALILIFSSPITIFAASSVEEIYDEQLKVSGALEMPHQLPEETLDNFKDMGINSVKWEDLLKITPEKILKKTLDITKEHVPGVFKSISIVLAAILLSALLGSMKESIGQKSIQEVWGIISSLFICTAMVSPIICTIGKSAAILNGTSKYLLCYIPVMAGVMIASGQSVSAASFSITMMTVSESIAQIANHFLVPLLSSFLAISVVSSISPTLNFSGLCNVFSKFLKWLLGFLMAVFSGILTLQNIIGSSADTMGTKATKFMLNGCIPIVGGALSDALLTIQSSVKLLKAGVGAFFILAVGFIFLPIMLECMLWVLSTNLCASIGEIFDLTNISKLLKRMGEVMNLLLLTDLCVAVVLIVSTSVILIISGSVS